METTQKYRCSEMEKATANYCDLQAHYANHSKMEQTTKPEYANVHKAEMVLAKVKMQAIADDLRKLLAQQVGA